MTVPIQQPQTSIQIDKMQESPHIWGDTVFLETEDIDIDETKIFWMGTNANLSDTPQEQLENKLAIQEQIRKGILDEFGLPTGFTYDELGIPKEKQDEIKAAKANRQKQIANNKPQLRQSVSQQQHDNAPTQRKVYNNKFERKMDRMKMREEAKKQEKLNRANEFIRQHQLLKAQIIPGTTTTTSNPPDKNSTVSDIHATFKLL